MKVTVVAVSAAGISAWQMALTLTVVVVVLAVLLRRWPLAALGLLLAESVAAALLVDSWLAPLRSVLQVLLVVLTGLVVCYIAATRARRVSIGAAAVALGVQVGSVAVRPGGVVTGRALALSTSPALAEGLIVVLAWLIGHSIRQAHAHTEMLRTRSHAEAATAERLRIARDLHDQVAHSIGIIAIQAGMARRVIDAQPVQARDALEVIEVTSRQTLAGLRQTVGALRRAEPRPAVSLPVDPLTGLAGLGQLVAATREAGVNVEVEWRGERHPLPPDLDMCAFRIIQEAVTNVVRHAGTSRCRVSIDHGRDGELSVEVTDDGIGGAIRGSGYGITGMRERAALAHGKLTAGPRPEGGFRVAASLPVPAMAR